jgi:uncharacterized protein YbbC (DUF1343 family)
MNSKVRTIKQGNILKKLTAVKIVLLIAINFLIFSEQGKAENFALGIDVLEQSGFEILKGKKVALLTNHSGRNSEGISTVEILKNSDSVELSALFTPEHGFYTTVPAGKAVSDEKIFGVSAYSLYGLTKSPPASLLEKFDVVVVDIQDIGVRSYTYISTVFKTMKACAENGKPIIILDRPNPLGGLIFDGNTVEPGMESFVGIIPVSYIHGCTIGELAEMISGEGWLGGLDCDLTVVKMNGWHRHMMWEDTGLTWYPTSPHIPTVNSVRGIAALGIFGELGIISIGIGTTLPFQYLGSPDLKTFEVQEILDSNYFQGLQLVPTRFHPFYGMYSGKYSNGWQLQFPLDAGFRPYTSGIRIFLALRKVHPELLKSQNISSKSRNMFEKVTGSKELADAILTGKSDEEILRLANKGLAEFAALRKKYLLYD